MNEQQREMWLSTSLMETIWIQGVAREGELTVLAYWTYLYRRDVDPTYPYDPRCRTWQIESASKQADPNAYYGPNTLETVQYYTAKIDKWDVSLQQLSVEYFSQWDNNFELLGISQSSGVREIKKTYEETKKLLEHSIARTKQCLKHLESSQMFDSYFSLRAVLTLKQEALERLSRAYDEVVSK